MALYKPQKKSFSPEEAKLMAIEAIKHFWVGSPPLFGAFPKESDQNNFNIYPIHENFFSAYWIVFFIDPTSYELDGCMKLFSVFIQRYGMHDFKFMLMYKPVYSYYLEKYFIDDIYKKLNTEIPLAIDKDNAIEKALGIKHLPHIMIFNKKEGLYYHGPLKEYQESERQIQNSIRSADPGTPFHTPYELSSPWINTDDYFELKNLIEQKMISFSNEWIPNEESIFTKLKNERIILTLPKKNFGIIARCNDLTKVQIFINGDNVPDECLGEDAFSDSVGRTFVEISSGKFYRILTNLEKSSYSDKIKVEFVLPSPVGSQFFFFGIRTGAIDGNDTEIGS